MDKFDTGKPDTVDEPVLLAPLNEKTADISVNSSIITVNAVLPDSQDQPELLENSISQPPDGGLTAWLTVVASFSIHFIVLGTQYSYGIYQRYYQNIEFKGKATNSEISFVGTLSTAVMLALGSFVGAIADGRLGYQKTAAIGTVLVSASLILASFCGEIWQFYLTQGFLLGLGSALCFFPAVSIPSQWFLNKRALATGVAVAGSGVGGIVVTVATNAMIKSIGFRWALRVTGIVSFVLLGGSIPFLKTRIPSKRHGKLFDFSIFRNNKFVPLFMSSVFAPFGYLIPFFFLPLYCDSVGLSAEIGATMLSIVNGLSIAGRILMGVIADRIGHINALIICLGISGVDMLVFWLFGNSVAMLSIFSIIYGFFAGGFISLVPVVSAHLFGIQTIASIIGILYSGTAAGNLGGPPIAGKLIDLGVDSGLPSGTYAWAIIFGGVMMVIAAVWLVYLRWVIQKEKRNRRSS